MIRSKPMTCATIIRLNYVEPPAVIEERPPTADLIKNNVKAPPKKK
jgi:hypothetical protein